MNDQQMPITPNQQADNVSPVAPMAPSADNVGQPGSTTPPNNAAPKKKPILIIAIVAIVLLVAIIAAIIMLLPKGEKENKEASKNEETSKESKEEPEKKEEVDTKGYKTIYDRIGVSDKITSFTGPFYGTKGETYTLEKLAANYNSNVYYPTNPTVDNDYKSGETVVYRKMLEKLGTPNMIIEKYTNDVMGEDYLSGAVILVWRTSDGYYIDLTVDDFTNWKKSDYTYPDSLGDIAEVGVSKNSHRWDSLIKSSEKTGDYKVYGKENILTE